ncbi:Lrp/AsnC family transcriptional regulator [Pseudoroseomonas globiformis]|uniref:Lrp/AsnC family transcriptional regulator n=1 Tax=Teichococcus globiformis TaxID=2307229 RepID=A0ABV7GAC1_9PROT
MTNLDAIDRKILQLLSRDARLSVERVAEQVNLSATPVRRRIRQLEQAGVIRRYTLDIDMKACGYGLRLFAFIKLQSRDRATIRDFEERVRALPEVTSCNLITGAHDYILEMNVRDMETYNLFLRSILAELPGVFGIETSVLIGQVKNEVPLPY